MDQTNFHPRCDCHKCTQARYRMSFQWQLDQFTFAHQSNLGVPVIEVPKTGDIKFQSH